MNLLEDVKEDFTKIFQNFFLKEPSFEKLQENRKELIVFLENFINSHLKILEGLEYLRKKIEIIKKESSFLIEIIEKLISKVKKSGQYDDSFITDLLDKKRKIKELLKSEEEEIKYLELSLELLKKGESKKDAVHVLVGKTME